MAGVRLRARGRRLGVGPPTQLRSTLLTTAPPPLPFPSSHSPPQPRQRKILKGRQNKRIDLRFVLAVSHGAALRDSARFDQLWKQQQRYFQRMPRSRPCYCRGLFIAGLTTPRPMSERANRSRHPAQLSSVARCGVQWPPNGPLLDFRTSVQFTANVLRAIVQSEPTCYPVYVYHRSQATDHLILQKRDNDPKHDLRCSSKFWCQI